MKIILEGENANRYLVTIAHVMHCAECREHLKIIDKLMEELK